MANVTGDSGSMKTRTARKAEEDSDEGNDDLSRQLFKQDDGGIAFDDDQKVLNDSNANKSMVGESKFRKQQSILKN